MFDKKYKYLLIYMKTKNLFYNWCLVKTMVLKILIIIDDTTVKVTEKLL